MRHFMFVWLNLFSNLFQAQTHECRGKREKWIVVQLFPHSLSISSLFLHFLPLFPFPTSMHHILLQNVKYGTFVANVTKISTYAL